MRETRRSCNYPIQTILDTLKFCNILDSNIVKDGIAVNMSTEHTGNTTAQWVLQNTQGTLQHSGFYRKHREYYTEWVLQNSQITLQHSGFYRTHREHCNTVGCTEHKENTTAQWVVQNIRRTLQPSGFYRTQGEHCNTVGSTEHRKNTTTQRV